MEEQIKIFLNISDGYGSGDGSGSGSGDGSGDGDGSGIKKFEGHEVFVVDDMPTLIYTVHGNYARGAILQSDLNLAP